MAHQGAGDLLMMVPALKTVNRSLSSNDHVYLLINSLFERQIAEQLRWECRIHFVEVGNCTATRVRKLLKFLISHMWHRPDVLVAPLLYDRPFNAVFVACLRSKVSVGHSGRWIGSRFSKIVNWKTRQLQHQVEYYNECFCASGLVSEVLENSVLPIHTVDDAYARDVILRNAGTSIIIGFGPGASRWQMQKCWPLRYYSALAEMLVRKIPGVNIALFGGANDRDLFEEIIKGVKVSEQSFLKIAGSDFGQTLAVMKRCACVVAGTTGLGHMAAAADVPIVVPCIPTNPAESGPWSDKAWVLTADLLCAPCYRDGFKLCGEFECMSLIPPRRVFDAVRSILDGETPPAYPRKVTTNAAGYLRLHSE